MNLTVLLDVAIGVALVYLGASLFVTIVNEYVAQVLQLRGEQLASDLKELLAGDEQVKEALKKNPALAPLVEPSAAAGQRLKVGLLRLAGLSRKDKPSFVDTDVLARLLVGLHKSSKLSPTLGGQIALLEKSVKDDVERLSRAVSHWADQSLTMMGEVYKRKTQAIGFGIGLAIAVAFNLNTIALAVGLYEDKEARDATSAAAVELVASVDQDVFNRCLTMAPAERAEADECASLTHLVDGMRHRSEAFGLLPIGWPRRPTTGFLEGWVYPPVGWILTAMALSLGASFWFDLLGRLVNIRSGMRRPVPGGSSDGD